MTTATAGFSYMGDWCNACDTASDDKDTLMSTALMRQIRCYDLMPNSATLIVFDVQLQVLSRTSPVSAHSKELVMKVIVYICNSMIHTTSILRVNMG